MLKKNPETILVVDDDPLMLHVIEEEISYHGFKPITASNGEEALKKAENEEVDLLVTDIMMPGMNGVDLAKKLTVMKPNTKVLFMSGYVCPSVAHQGTPGSEFSFIQKPFAPDTLVQKMKSVLSGPEGLQDLEEPSPS